MTPLSSHGVVDPYNLAHPLDLPRTSVIAPAKLAADHRTCRDCRDLHA